MSGIVMILQIFGKYAREICQVLSRFYKYVALLVSTTNKTDCHDINEILLKMALHHNPNVR
jgi:hypothetical protein